MKIGIIGAGVTGLTCAMELSKKGHIVTIIETDSNYGGLASSIQIGNTNIEKFYHHIFNHDLIVLDVIEELGLTPNLKWIEPKNAIFINDKLYPFSTPMDLMTFSELPLINRFLMGLMVLRAKYVKDWKPLESISAKQWIIQLAGQSVYDKVWGPLLYSKFDIDSEKVSAVWLWNKFKLRGSTRSKGFNKELLGYMDGGFELIYKSMVEKIKSNGSILNLNETLLELSENEDSSINAKTSSATYKFDKVILTFAPTILNNIKTSFSSDYINKINKIKYKANICMLLELKKSLTPYYWITIADKTLPFVLFVEHTNFMAPDNYNANVVYLSRYIDENDPMYEWDDERIKKSFIDSISKISPDFKEEDIVKSHLNRARFTQPVVSLNYSDIILDYQTPIKNIYMANMANIYPEDRGQNYSMRLGKEISNIVLGGNG